MIMKYLIKIATLLLINLFSYHNIYSAIYPFPSDSLIRWTIKYEFNDPFVCHEIYFYEYSFLGDTVLSNISYKKVYRQHTIRTLSEFGIPGCSINEPSNGYAAAFREDTLTRKCYLVLPGDSSENMLYDFSLTVGDTLQSVSLPHPDPFCFDTNYLVISIDSDLVDNVYHKALNFDCTAKMIAGVGSLYEPFLNIDQLHQLVCVHRDSVELYHNPISPGFCQLPTSISETKKEPITIIVSAKKVEIKSSTEIKSIAIYNVELKKVLELFPVNKDCLLNLPEVCKGFYILSITLKNDNLINKKIQIF